MSWWKTLLGPSAAGRAGEPTWPVELEVVTGKLSARVYLHDIEFQSRPIACWSYVSHGLAALEQPEIVFTLRRDPDEPSDGFPQDPLHLLATIYQLADDDRRVGPGDVSEFGDRSFLGHHLLYVEARPLDRVPLPPSCLAALLISTDELRAVREFGTTRVLARMGHASGYYPFPPWADRRRLGLSLARTFEQSLLSKLPGAAFHDVRVAIESNQIIVSALRGALAARSSVRELAAFCHEVQRCAQGAIGDRDDAAELVIRMRCTPEGHDVYLSGRGEVPGPDMQAFFEAVKQLARLPVQDGEVSFEIELTVSR